MLGSEVQICALSILICSKQRRLSSTCEGQGSGRAETLAARGTRTHARVMGLAAMSGRWFLEDAVGRRDRSDWRVAGPNKNVYAKIKSDLREGAARTVGTLWKLVGRSARRLRQPIAPVPRHADYRA